MIRQSHSRAYIRTKLEFKKIHANLYSQQHHSQRPRHGNNLSVNWQTNKEDACVRVCARAHVCVWILLSHKKDTICSNIAGSRDYHTNWRKSERQRPYGISYMWNLKYDTDELACKSKSDSWTQRTGWWPPKQRAVGVGWGGRLGLAGTHV